MSPHRASSRPVSAHRLVAVRRQRRHQRQTSRSEGQVADGWARSSCVVGKGRWCGGRAVTSSWWCVCMRGAAPRVWSCCSTIARRRSGMLRSAAWGSTRTEQWCSWAGRELWTRELGNLQWVLARWLLCSV
ncbi:hypothetical protein IG631_18956 [Alternaria alternata]|nr:hypothetical protein IG631_18956 [Alternaria alternata]